MEKIDRKTFLKEAVVLLIAAVMILSTVTVTADTVNNQTQKNMFSKLGAAYNTQPQTNIEKIIPSIVGLRDQILFESFEDTWIPDSDGDLAPPGWENHITDFTDTGSPYFLPHYWGQYGTVTSFDPPAVPPDGEYQAIVQWSYNHQDEWLITPLLDLSDYENCEVTFWRYGHTGSTHGDHYYVKASPNGGFDKTDFTDILWDASGLPPGDNHYDTPYNIDLSVYDGTSIRLAWHNEDPPTNDGLWYGSCIDAVGVAGEKTIEPLVADADGPYEAFDDEPIQFQGSATGGVPPYSFHWDFGNGDTSNEEDPVYVYEDPGVYDVTLTVTDDEQNTDDDQTTATIEGRPILDIGAINGGLLKVRATIKNIGSIDANDVAWSIELSGGLILLGKTSTGTVDIPPGGEVTVESNTIIGIGQTTVTVKATMPESSDTGSKGAFVFVFFIIIT